MPRYLLDEQISPTVADHLVRKYARKIHAVSLHRWRDGALLGTEDARVLMAAAADRLTLVTYDLRTIPRLLAEFAETGTDHGGVILVDEVSVPPDDFGALIGALALFWRHHSRMNWRNRAAFLQRDPDERAG